ncbi:hypothetical protein OLMES_3371 [Oleiphilus messinensis]|uniref:PKD domain-containing protein n=2 Tax=Oleiphilus messinensis TaxID=141451 RepID=A0A1Y0IB72_9GAMM|nr:cellulose binding domain-containing protein [Oleiphilus messinensis]ARU57409.1 hypothetical protein OLMES_3371 [Oleiphilus messinensis]
MAATCEYTVVNEWNTGFTASVQITNNSDQEIDGWMASLDFPDGVSISQIWNASVAAENPYHAVNMSYNAKILPGSRVDFGFNGQKSTANQPAQIPVLGGICETDISNHPPVAIVRASAQTGDAPFAVSFYGSDAYDPDGDELTYLWAFGDGTVSSLRNPIHTFTTPGIYAVTLTVSDGSLTSPPATTTVQVTSSEPVQVACHYEIENEWNAGFTASVKLTNQSGQAIEGWTVTLDFPDDTTINHMWNANLTGSDLFYAANKPYNATIQSGSTVDFGFNGTKANLNTSAKLPVLGGICTAVGGNQPPVAVMSASSTSGVVPLTVNFDGSGSTDPDGDDLGYLWDFGDGTFSNEATPTHTFDQVGNYAVTLTVTDGSLDSQISTLSISAQAPEPDIAYSLDSDRSSLYFVSTKKVHVVETHQFTDLSGSVSETGTVRLRINLDSVETGIDIRNQRMRDFLFETGSFNYGEVELNIDLTDITAMDAGSTLERDISPVLDLHGFRVPINTQVRITKLQPGQFLVQNTTPIIVNAADFGLTAGIDVLRELAGLNVISYSVPTNFTLVFNAQ